MWQLSRMSRHFKIDYKDSGVDIDQADRLIDQIIPRAQRTKRPGVLHGIGSFGALFALRDVHKSYKDPILVSGCDGVGTKLKIAFMAHSHRTIGIDLVAMSVNDILCHGAEPLFFLDYFATSQLSLPVASDVIEGICVGCELAGCSLVGGETAELPGFYSAQEYDLAGFALGVVERAQMLPCTSLMKEGDVILGLASNGLHSNGYSLARKLIFETLQLKLEDELPMQMGLVKDELLKPTRIYVKAMLKILEQMPVLGIAHITGGGLIENLPRILPKHLSVALNPVSWPIPKIFTILQSAGHLSSFDMFRTFNMGIGLACVVSREQVSKVRSALEQQGEEVFVIGSLVNTAINSAVSLCYLT